MIDPDRLARQIASGGAHRTADAAAIEDLLLLSGWFHAAREEEEDSKARAGARALLDTLVTAGLPIAGDGRFDPAEVVDFLTLEGLRGANGAWRSHYVATGRRLVGELCGSTGDVAPDMEYLPPRRFALAFERIFDLRGIPPETLLRLRLPLPIEDAQLTGLSVTPEPFAAPIRTLPGRLETRMEAAGQLRISLAAHFSFTAHAGVPHGAEMEEDRQIWLAPREGEIVVTPRVRALAEQLSACRNDGRDRLRAFRDHILDTLACGIVHHDRIGARPATDWMLDHGWFDCRLGAALLVALCRAVAIPARLIGGYLLWDAPSEHYWMEAWLPEQGWTPVDLLAWDLSAGGRDPGWRDIYAGALDYRMKTQIFPGLFTGAPGVAMGEAWHRLPRMIPGGVAMEHQAIPSGAPLYTDRIRLLKA